jgi:anthranilate phosphoribosyltransferase
MFGVKLDPDPKIARQCLDEVNICFLFAPQYHGGLRHAMPVRRELKVRTVFNLLGPLVNPAAPPVQLMGVYDPELLMPVSRTLAQLGVRRSLVVHGQGLDEISISGPTEAVWGESGELREITITPDQAGLTTYPVEALAGGDARENHAAIGALLRGEGEPAHEAAVAINAGAAAWIAGKANDLQVGTEQAVNAIRSGDALGRIDRWAEVSNGS